MESVEGTSAGSGILGSLSGRGLSETALQSIVNRGAFQDPERLPPGKRTVLRCRWQAHGETLRRGAEKILAEIRAHRTIERWPLGKTYWLQLLLEEHASYRRLMQVVDDELSALGA